MRNFICVGQAIRARIKEDAEEIEAAVKWLRTVPGADR